MPPSLLPGKRSLPGSALFVGAYETAGAHLGAPVCGSPEAGAGVDSVRQESGRVTRKYESGGDSTSYMLTVARETAPGDSYSVSRSFYRDVKVGTSVDLKVYRDAVVRLAHRGHEDEQRAIPVPAVVEVALLVSGGTAVGLHGLRAPARGRRWRPTLMAVPTVVATLLGSSLLIVYQWSFAATLTVSVVGWLIAVFAGAAVVDS